MIHVLTLSHGRAHYLWRCRESLKAHSGLWPDQWRHWIQFQGWWPGEAPYGELILWEPVAAERPEAQRVERIGIAAGIKAWLEYARPDPDDLVVKLDEDALVHSDAFLLHVEDIHRIWPKLAFHAFPVGIKGFMDPTFGYETKVSVFAQPTIVDARYRFLTAKSSAAVGDRYYALLRSPFLGGLARVCPAWMMLECPWEQAESEPQGNCDGVFSSYCLANNLSMAYCMNAVVVEHNESVAQRLRYPEYAGTEHRNVRDQDFRSQSKDNDESAT